MRSTLLVLLLASTAVPALAAEEFWYSLKLNGAHSGYLMYSMRDLGDGRSEVAAEGAVSMKRMDQVMATAFAGSGIMKGETEMERFSGTVSQNGAKSPFSVEDKGDSYLVSFEIMGMRQEQEFPKDSPMFADDELAKRIAEGDLKVGQKITVPMGEDLNATLHYVKDEALEILGESKTYALMEVTYPMGIPVQMWVDPKGEELAKVTMTMPMVMSIELLRTTAKEAKQPAQNAEIFYSTLRPVAKELPAPATLASITFRLEEQWAEGLPEPPAVKGRQTAEKKDGAHLVTVTRRPLPKKLPFRKLKTKGVEEHLKSSFIIQSDNEQIIAQAKEIVGEEKDAVAATKRLHRWVNETMTGTMGVGYASALETLLSKQGDCTEHSVLLVGLLRASGIPARTASGFVYIPEEKTLGGHMWVEVWLNGWHPLDAALDMAKHDPGYLKTGDGNEFDPRRSLKEMYSDPARSFGYRITVESWETL